MLDKLIAALAFALPAPAALAQYAAAPTHYSLVNATADQVLHVYRDGDKALLDTLDPKSPTQPVEIHLRTIIDVPTLRDLSWDLEDPKVPCNGAGKSGPDWGDPFNYWNQMASSGPAPKKVGHETVHGMPATVFVSEAPEGEAKLWREDKYGLLVKAVMTPKGGKPVTMIDITEFKVGPPPKAAFKVPSRCAWPPK